MKEVIKTKIKSASSNGTIIYRVECDACNRLISSRPVTSSDSQKDLSKEQQIIHAAMFERDKERELTALVRKATEIFSLCPICHKLICDDCFLVCDDLDMCKDCASKLQAKGSVVAERAITAESVVAK